MKQGREDADGCRKANFKTGRTTRPGFKAKSYSIRLADEERAVLLERAGRQSLAVYIRNCLLSGGERVGRRRRNVKPMQDQISLARVLAMLGQSRIANNLNQLAKAANIGALPVTPETEAEIVEACVAVIAMRGDLLRALGLVEDGPR